MDFFERQADAQRKTRVLVLYFILALIGIIAAVQLVFSLLLDVSYTDLDLLGVTAIGVAAVVGFGSLFKIIELSKGGSVVAAMLGGEPVVPNTIDQNERRLLNVVEEMSIASGIPVPEVYLLPDPTINAFAAGNGVGDAVIGVTRGAVKKLTRDELQGVIAHEFSHILHGDMKLNMRLIGLLNGILGVALVGGFIMRYSAFSRVEDDRQSERGKSVNSLAMVTLAGLAIYIIGWIGVFFGNLIKAAVSRQREFLADASAVQFTRNPSGIANALWKIGQHRSVLSSPRAEEASHLFFGDGVGTHWLHMFATHPPLDERIKAIDPRFEPSPTSKAATPPPLPPTPPKMSGQEFIQSLGSAALLLQSIPAFAGEAVRDLHGACAFVYALLLDERDDYRQVQLDGLAIPDALKQEMLALFARRGELPIEQRLPLCDLVIPTLRHLSSSQYEEFRRNVQHLVESDQEVHLFEFALQKTILRHLEMYFTKSTGAEPRFKNIIPILPEVATLLSSLTYVGQVEPGERDAAFAAGVRELLVNTSAHPLQREDTCDLAKLDEALDKVATATPSIKRVILTACREAVTHNGVVDLQEYEILRAIADSLDCPMPPLPAVTTAAA